MKGVQWPVVVPILTADDIVKGYRNHDGDTHCLLGWNDAVFAGDWRAHDIVHKELESEIAETTGGVNRHDIARFNDNTAEGCVARLWNRVMRKLGYTVPCER